MPEPMPVLPGPARSMLPVAVPAATPSSRRHLSFSAPDRELQRLAPVPDALEGALLAPMPEPDAGAEPTPELSGTTLPLAPGVLLRVVLSAERLLAPAPEFNVPSAAVPPGAPLEV